MRTETPAPEPTRCPCDWIGENQRHERAEEVHENILGFEARGLAGVMDLLEYVEMSAEGVEDPPLFPHDLEAFVAQHNWDSPARVARLAARVADEHGFAARGAGLRAFVPSR